MKRYKSLNAVLFFALTAFLFCGLGAYAASGVTYHGRLLAPSGSPVTSSAVQFRMQIRTPGAEDCLLYEEIQTLDLSATSGIFALSLADGTGVRQDTNTWNLFGALANRGTFSFAAADCTGATTYAPNASDNRRFRVFFNDGTFAGWEALPLQTINFIPMSIESYAVGGFPASSLLRVENAGSLVNTSPLNNAQYTELLALLAGTSNQYTRAGQLNGVALPAIGNGESVRWNAGAWQSFTPLTSETDPNVEAFAKAALPTCGASEVLKSDGTSLSCVTDTTGGAPADATTAVKGIVVVPAAGGLAVSSGSLSLPDVVATGTYTKVTVDAKGRVTTGANITGDDITSGEIDGTTSINTSGNIVTSGNITGSAVSATTMSSRGYRVYNAGNTQYVNLEVPAGLAANYSMILPATNGTGNQILGMNNAASGMEYKSITQGSGVTITHSAGGIEISATGSGGIVTSITGTANQIAVDSSTPAVPVLSLADLAVSPAGSYGSATQVPAITVDAKGRVTAVTNTNITGVSPVGAALASGQAWMGTGGNVAAARYIGLGDIKTAAGTQQIPTACSASQTMVWSAITDVLSCTNITGVAAANISNTAAGNIAATDVQAAINELDSEKVAKAGDTMTGTLNLPANGLVAGTSQLVLSGGNVGIGTTNPQSSLHISSTINSAITLGIEGDNVNEQTSLNFVTKGQGPINNAATKGWHLVARGDQFDAGTYANDLGLAKYDGTSASYAIYFDFPTAYVGIGTTSPLGTLHVGGNADFFLDGQSPFLTTRSTTYPTSGTEVSGLIYLSEGSATANNWPPQAGMSFIATENHGGGARGTKISFSTTPNGSLLRAERMTIEEDGKIGIGTNDPSVELEVAGTIKATAFEGPLTSSSSSTAAGYTINTDTDNAGSDGGVSFQTNSVTQAQITSTGRVLASAGGGASTPGISFLSDPDTGLYNSAANTLSLVAGGVEGLRVNTVASGVNYVAITPAATGSSPTIASAGSDANIGLNINPKGAGAISMTGNVGIGTTIPNQSFQIVKSDATNYATSSAGATSPYGTSTAPVVSIVNSSSTDNSASYLALATTAANGTSRGGYIGFADGGSGTPSWGTLVFGGRTGANAYNERMRISVDSGRVGIGSTTPNALLDVNGNARVGTNLGVGSNPSANNKVYIYNTTANTPLVLARSDNTTGKASIDFSPTSTIDATNVLWTMGLFPNTNRFGIASWDGTTNTERITVLNSGNVGIGTTNPSSLFHVSKTYTGGGTQLLVNGDQSAAFAGSFLGIQANPSFSSTGTLGALYGMNIGPRVTGTGTVTTMYGITSVPTISDAGTVGDMYPLYSRCDLSHASASVTNCYGIRLAAPFGAGSANVTNVYGVYQDSSSATNYFAGKVGIGTSTPSSALHVGNGSVSINGTGLDGSALQRMQIYADTTLGGLIQAPQDSGGDRLDFSLGWRGGLNAITMKGSNAYVGIGTTNPTAKLHVATNGYTSLLIDSDAGSPADGSAQVNFVNDLGHIGDIGMARSGIAAPYGNSLLIRNQYASGDVLFGAGSSLPMILRSSGNVGVGTTVPIGRLEVNSGAAGALTGLIINTTTVGANTYEQYKANGVVIGSITSAAGANVAFNTTSDIRLKGGFEPVLSPIETLNQIEVTNFYYLSDASQTRMDGFKAQQLNEVLPYAVTKPEKEFNDDGSINPWQADYSKVVPMITAAVQELYEKLLGTNARVAKLEREIASIKAEALKQQQESEAKLKALEEKFERLEKALKQSESNF